MEDEMTERYLPRIICVDYTIWFDFTYTLDLENYTVIECNSLF